MLLDFKAFRSSFNKRGVFLSIYFVLTLITVNAFLTFKYKQALTQYNVDQKRFDNIKKHKDGILVNLNNIDMTVRGYLLVENPAFLKTLVKTKERHELDFKVLNETITEIGLDPHSLSSIQGSVDQYFLAMDTVIERHMAGKKEKALEIILEDRGTGVWERYVEFSQLIDPLIEEKKRESSKRYNDLLAMSLLFNIILFCIGIPTLVYASTRLRRNAKKQASLYEELDQKNRNLIFNSNETINTENQVEVVDSIIKNLDRTSNFIKEISNGNFEINWEGWNRENEELNKSNIAGALLMMRDEMQKKRLESERQQWVNDGLSKLSELLRDHQNEFSVLTEKTVSFLVTYINALQGGLFVLIEDEQSNKAHLELSSCYAYNRKKYIQKRVEIGEGLVGQTYLEAEIVYLSKIPETYSKITSGLGDSKPNSLIVVPLKHNEKVEAVLEIASFKQYENYVLEFLESACKTIAASIVTIRTNEKTRQLLQKSQQQAEEMRAQEEEMRQNMEELEATQEEMKRKEIELRNLLNQTQKGEELEPLS